jgi:transposase
LLAPCTERKVLKARGRQRSDATHVLAAIRVLNRLEGVGEALRQALNSRAVGAPTGLQAQVPAGWVDRYGARLESYRLPQSQAERQALATAIGAAGYRLPQALWDAARPAWLRALDAVQVLRQSGVQQFYQQEGRVCWREDGHLPPAAQRINAPPDPHARYGTKRSTTGVGYKVHLTASCAADTPHRVPQVQRTMATGTDYDTLPPIQQDLARRDLLPAEHLLDGG